MNKIISNVLENLNLSISKGEKDIGIYKSSISKMEQAKELIEELRKKYKVTIAGPNTICALIQSFHLGFTSLKIQKNATQIFNDLNTISTRFSKHFDNHNPFD